MPKHILQIHVNCKFLVLITAGKKITKHVSSIKIIKIQNIGQKEVCI